MVLRQEEERSLNGSFHGSPDSAFVPSISKEVIYPAIVT
jgi:hypothetical protein